MPRQGAPESREFRIPHQVAPRVRQRARDVGQIDAAALHRSLVAERAQRLQVALDGHELEAPLERVARLAGDGALSELLGPVGDELLVELDVAVTEQRGEV